MCFLYCFLGFVGVVSVVVVVVLRCGWHSEGEISNAHSIVYFSVLFILLRYCHKFNLISFRCIDSSLRIRIRFDATRQWHSQCRTKYMLIWKKNHESNINDPKQLGTTNQPTDQSKNGFQLNIGYGRFCQRPRTLHIWSSVDTKPKTE